MSSTENTVCVYYIDCNNVFQNGLLSALPYAILWINGFLYGNIVTWMTETNRISMLNVRRLSMSIGKVTDTIRFLVSA